MLGIHGKVLEIHGKVSGIHEKVLNLELMFFVLRITSDFVECLSLFLKIYIEDLIIHSNTRTEH